MSLSVEEIKEARSLGGGALIRKHSQLESKIKSGKAGRVDKDELEKVEGRIKELAGKVIGRPVDTREPMQDTVEDKPEREADSKPTKLQLLERIDNLKAFGRQGRMIERMYSKKLDKFVAVISRPEQRSLIKDTLITVYTIEEAIIMTESEIESDPETYKAVDMVKDLFDGDVVSVQDAV